MWHISAGILFGLVIGLVSSLLGVAGGELIIPTLVFAFGADIKTAGTASLIISLPTVFVGVVHYTMRGAFDNRKDLTSTVAPMGVGSVIGSFIGVLLVRIISASTWENPQRSRPSMFLVRRMRTEKIFQFRKFDFR